MSEIIRLENAVKMTGDQRIINDVSFTIPEGEHVQICGTDERGRAMLMKLIAGMERPSAGKIIVRGKAVHEMNADRAAAFRNKTYGICLKEPSFMPNLTVWENVALPLVIRGVDTLNREKAAKEQLKQLGIRTVAHAYPAQLKPQEAQIASIARAVVTQPPVLLLEELTAGLSERQAGTVTDVLHVLSTVGEATVVSFTPGEAPGAKRRLVLEHGKIREETI